MSRLTRMPRLVGIGIITILIVAVLCGFMVSKINASGLEGTTESISLDEGVVTAVVVNGQTILIDNNTKIEGTLVAAAKVEVKYITQPDSTLLATRIDVEDSDDQENINDDDTDCDNSDIDNDDIEDNKTEGSLASFSDTEVVVNGQTILIDSNTRIEGTLAEGAKVDVKYVVQGDGSLLATKIEIEDNDDEEDVSDKDEDDVDEEDVDSDDSDIDNGNIEENETAGRLVSFSDTEVVVNSQTILIDSNTRIEDTLVEGSKVEVKYITQADNTLLATKIEVEDSDDEKDVNDDDQDKTIIKPVKVQNNGQTMDNTPSSKGKLDRQGDDYNEDDDDEEDDNEDEEDD
jgi:hypothetical protein